MVDSFHNMCYQAENDFEREEYIVERIIDKKERGEEVFYLVKWQNYKERNLSWEPESKLINLQELIKEYEDDLKSGKLQNNNDKNFCKSKSKFFPPEGNLVTDRPQEVRKIKIKDDCLYLKVVWFPRVSGITPRQTMIRYEDIRTKFPNLLLDFYEEHTNIGDKPMSKLVNKNKYKD